MARRKDTLDERDIAEIMRLHKMGLDGPTIAARFRRTKSTINDIIRAEKRKEAERGGETGD